MISGIDYERLKLREKILFFDEVILYEDELDDNGCAVLSSKIVSDKKLNKKIALQLESYAPSRRRQMRLSSFRTYFA